MGIIRAAWSKLTGQDLTSVTFSGGAAVVDDIRNYFNRLTERTQLKTAIINMYATGIVQEPDPAKKSAYLETYTKQGFKAVVDNDMVEIFSIGFGQKIVGALASMFTEDGNKYTLQSDDGTKLENAEELLFRNRENGGHRVALVRADKLAVQCGSSVVYLAYENDSVVYRHLAPNKVRVFFDDYIEENGKARATNPADIEDATYIVIQLGTAGINKWHYLAIFGRSERYPNGRHVNYIAGDTIEVPEDNTPGVIEYTNEAGELANPLSIYANEHEDLNIPEYPIAALYSGLTEDGTALPISASLYNTCIEFSRAASHTLSKSQEAASGTTAISDDGSGKSQGKSLPRTTTGVVHLKPGQKAERLAHDSASIETAYKTLKGLMIDVAGGYYVPDFMVVSEDYTLDASSGVALAIKTRPLKEFREFRIDENSQSVKKIFNIEVSLISLFADTSDSAAVAELEKATQVWDAGQIELPENKLEETNRIKIAGEMGVIDEIGKIREYHKFTNDDDAIAYYEMLRDRRAEYLPLNQPETPAKPPLGLPGRGRIV